MRKRRDKTYEEAASLGAELLNKIVAGNNEPSQYDQYDMLRQNGWDANEEQDGVHDIYKLPLKNIETVAQAADLGIIFTRWIGMIDQEAKAQYWEFFNVERGTFISFSNKLEEPVPNQLSRFSDVTFLAWKEMCSRATPPVDPGSMRHMLRYSITNDNTMAIIRKAMEESNRGVLKPWPGDEFSKQAQPNFQERIPLTLVSQAWTPKKRRPYWDRPMDILWDG